MRIEHDFAGIDERMAAFPDERGGQAMASRGQINPELRSGIGSWGGSIEELIEGSVDRLDGDRLHAIMADRTVALETGAAGYVLVMGPCQRVIGIGRAYVGRAENGDLGNAEGCGGVHQSGIVGKENIGLGNQGEGFGKGCASAEIRQRRVIDRSGNGLIDRLFGVDAQQDNPAASIANEPPADLGVAVGEPAFCRT